MPRRLLDPNNADRVVAVVFGLYFLQAAPALWSIWADGRSGPAVASPVFFDWAWPFVYALAGCLGVLYAWKSTSLRLAAWSGGLMILAVLSRAATIFVTWATGESNLSFGSVVLAATTWSVLGYAIGTIWTRFLYPVNRARREGAG